MKLLLTGFEPFGGSDVNPSEKIARALDGSTLNGWTIHGHILPVENQTMPAQLLAAIRSTSPNAIVCLGEAGRRPCISIERIAVNLQDYEIPDNRGEKVTDQPIRPDGPAGYFSTLPTRAIYQCLQQAGIPVEYSLSAGAYLCNLAFYTVMDYCSRSGQSIPAGFIHLPSLPEQAAKRNPPTPSMDFDRMLLAIKLAIKEITSGF